MIHLQLKKTKLFSSPSGHGHIKLRHGVWTRMKKKRVIVDHTNRTIIQPLIFFSWCRSVCVKPPVICILKGIQTTVLANNADKISIIVNHCGATEVLVLEAEQYMLVS